MVQQTRSEEGRQGVATILWLRLQSLLCRVDGPAAHQHTARCLDRDTLLLTWSHEDTKQLF